MIYVLRKYFQIKRRLFLFAELPFAANIDIRDTVKYKEVMKQYGLGPNGAILTSLNLFATRFDQVIKLIEARVSETDNEASSSPDTRTASGTPEPTAGLDYVFIDTPGQIEVFTWSAGGQIIHEVREQDYFIQTIF
jgi:GPN-loop GTPase